MKIYPYTEALFLAVFLCCVVIVIGALLGIDVIHIYVHLASRIAAQL